MFVILPTLAFVADPDSNNVVNPAGGFAGVEIMLEVGDGGFVELGLRLPSRQYFGGGSSIFLAERGPVFVQNLSNGCCGCGGRSVLRYHSDGI